MTTQDAGFKYLLGRYPDEALALFCPEALAERGAPAGATLLATEVPILSADSTHRLMDLAVLFTWPAHPGLIITLLEHWSDRHRIDLPRVLRYTAELVLRHPEATVLPIILLTDDWPEHRPPPVLRQGLGGWIAVHLAPRLVPLRRPEAIPAGHYGNHVAILLAVLVPTPPEQRADLIASIPQLSHIGCSGRFAEPPIFSALRPILAGSPINLYVKGQYRALWQPYERRRRPAHPASLVADLG
jgi:hypothetical protein